MLNVVFASKQEQLKSMIALLSLLGLLPNLPAWIFKHGLLGGDKIVNY
ncbi:hypothetical protein [Candidatus Enterovibrio escicola]|nr:hypothetical protein [Candidatus Enterovibrio escacola]